MPRTPRSVPAADRGRSPWSAASRSRSAVAGMAGAWVRIAGADDATVAIEIHYSHYVPAAVTVPLGVPVTFVDPQHRPDRPRVDRRRCRGPRAPPDRHGAGPRLAPDRGHDPGRSDPHDDRSRSRRGGRSSTSATSRATRRTGWSARSGSAPAEPRPQRADTDRAPRRREARPLRRTRCSGPGAALRQMR